MIEEGNAKTVWLVHSDARRDYSAAEEYGTIKEVFSSIHRNFDPTMAVQHARRVLKNYKDGDYLVMTGDPVLCAVCVTVVAETNGRCSVLRWDRNKLNYSTLVLAFY